MQTSLLKMFHISQRKKRFSSVQRKENKQDSFEIFEEKFKANTYKIPELRGYDSDFVLKLPKATRLHDRRYL